MNWPWRRPPTPQADPDRIAVLEYELFGIEPKPGTAAALAVRLHRTVVPREGDRVGVVDFPAGIRRSEADKWCVNYEHMAANSITVQRPDGGVEILYVDPSGKHPR